MLIRILKAGPYLDLNNELPFMKRKAIKLKEGDRIDYPIEYAQRLIGLKLAKALEVISEVKEDEEPLLPEATEAAVKIAHKYGLIIEDVVGTGAGGRVTQADVQKHFNEITEAERTEEDDD